MRRRLRATVLGAGICASFAAAAWAQGATASAASSGGDPLNALWSLLGSSPVAFVLWQWAKSEQTDRRSAVDRMLAMFEADAEHKAALRERLKGQDDALAKQMDLLRAIDRRLDAKASGP